MNEEKTAAYERLTPQRKQLVDAVLKNLENGTGLWEQGWAGGDAPVSAITGKQYNNGSRSSRINDGIEELDGFCDMGTIAGWKFDLMAYKEVALSQVFREDISHHDLFYTGRFDFVVFDKRTKNPLPAIELDGKEHHDDETVKARDRQKEEICRQHNFQLIHVENSYARRYAYIKTILTEYFSKI